MPSITDTKADDGRVRFGPILLQKSKVAGRLIFREIMKREAIADSYKRLGQSPIFFRTMAATNKAGKAALKQLLGKLKA
jgi:hypothetical protein